MLRLEGLTRRFGDTVAVDDVSLEVCEGEVLSLLGPSGCGKTTTLRMIAGFEEPTSGSILLRDRDITSMTPQRRGVGMVFQNYALFPHLNVAENVAFGLESRGERGAAVRERTERALELVELPGFGERRVQELSGGQQQRVALARAIAPEPPLLLLDEPLSNLDAALRERTRGELRALLKRLGITSVFVTHDQEEAFAVSDRVAVLEAGRLQQLGTPETLYAEPANPFVANFLGRANWLAATVEAVSDGRARCRLHAGPRWKARLPEGEATYEPGDQVRVMARPESLRLEATQSADGDGALTGRIVDLRFAGASSFYRVALDDGTTVTVQGGSGEGVSEAEVGVALRDGVLPIVFASDAGIARELSGSATG
jgi:iron(III) transport system ATP-binding protein